MKPKAKKRGIVVTVARDSYGHFYVWDKSELTDLALVCGAALRRAGMRPLKPGESRKVRIIIEDETNGGREGDD